MDGWHCIAAITSLMGVLQGRILRGEPHQLFVTLHDNPDLGVDALIDEL